MILSVNGITSLNSANQLAIITEKCYVLFEEGTKFLNIIQMVIGLQRIKSWLFSIFIVFFKRVCCEIYGCGYGYECNTVATNPLCHPLRAVTAKHFLRTNSLGVWIHPFV